MSDKLKVLFLSSEAVPFAKTGGLADVAGALPVALKRLGLDVRLVLPFYRITRDSDLQIRPRLTDLKVPFGAEILMADVLECKTKEGVLAYLIDREDMYDRLNLYGNDQGDHYDNLERFSFFSHAVFAITEAIRFIPDVIHCHDWQTGLVPALLQSEREKDSALWGTPSVFTIHNIGYQGIFPKERFPVTGLPMKRFFHLEGVEFWGKISLLKAGIVYADAVTTVSPKYAEEIQTPEYGMGMEEIVKHWSAKLYGILNGADYGVWDPSIDPHISASYSFDEISGKRKCKESLIQEMDLDPALEGRPLLGMISRLGPQKGFDLLLSVLNKIMALDVGLVILGSGERTIAEAIKEAAGYHPRRLGFVTGYDDPLAHRIMSAADLFLIPSRYEPCGLTQMYALKYGTVPVVRATGGLDDTVQQFNPTNGKGNGFKFSGYEPKAFLDQVRYAVDVFQVKKIWRSLLANGMRADFSWERSAQNYLEIYRSIAKGTH
jgi:starch synthase